jgi:hypothetical protein
MAKAQRRLLKLYKAILRKIKFIIYPLSVYSTLYSKKQYLFK